MLPSESSCGGVGGMGQQLDEARDPVWGHPYPPCPHRSCSTALCYWDHRGPGGSGMVVMGTCSVGLGCGKSGPALRTCHVIPPVPTQDTGLIIPLTGGDTEALRWEVASSDLQTVSRSWASKALSLAALPPLPLQPFNRPHAFLSEGLQRISLSQEVKLLGSHVTV